MSVYEEGLVSIITPNYNCEKFIVETIESVINQTYKKWEMIIVDDCSTDNSITIARNYEKKDDRIKVIKNERNMGAALSRNKAIEIAKGEYIAFLDSDDVWQENKLEKQLHFMKSNNCDFSFTEYYLMDMNSHSLFKTSKVIKKLTYNKMLFHTFTGCLTVMYNQSEIGKVYGPDVKNCNDKALFLKVLKKTNNAMGISLPLAKYRIRNNSISSSKIKMLRPYIIVLNKHENINKILCLFFVFTHVIIKKALKYKKNYETF